MSVMTPERMAHVFGAGPIELQIEQARALYHVFRSADSNWRLEEHPFLRGVSDPWIVTSQIAVAQGGVSPPNGQRFWEELFDRADVTRRDVAGLATTPGAPVWLAWLAQKIESVAAKERRDRFEMVRFAQGVFGSVGSDDATEAMVALGGYRRYRALLLSLDRMGIVTPRVYARAVEAARRLDDLSGRDRKHSVIAFQTSIGILERTRLAGPIHRESPERTLLALAAPVRTGRT